MSNQRVIALAGILILIALIVRSYNIERQSLWNDEMFTMDVAARSPDAIQERLSTYYHHPPLYFYLAHYSAAIFGMTAWSIRLPSVIFGALTIGLIYLFARKLFNNIAGIVAAAICLAAPFHLAYSQEGRPYALAAFLCVASFYTFYILLNERKRYAILLYPLSTLALLYTHHWGLFVVGVQFIYFIVLNRGKVNKDYLLFIIWMIIGIFYLPEFIALRNQFIQASTVSWFWAESPSWEKIYHLLTAFSGTYFKMAALIFSLPVILRIAGAIILLGLLITGIWFAVQTKKSDALRFSLISFGGLIAIPFAISFFKPEIFLWYRYTVIAYPLLCVAIGGILFFLEKRGKRLYFALAISAVGVLIVTGIIGTYHYMSWQKSNVKEVALFTDQLTSAHQVRMIIRPKTFAPLLNYYYSGTAVQHDETYLDQPLGEIIDTATSFVYISLDIPNEIKNYMDGHFDKIAECRFPAEANMGMIVGLYKQKPEIEEPEE